MRCHGSESTAATRWTLRVKSARGRPARADESAAAQATGSAACAAGSSAVTSPPIFIVGSMRSGSTMLRLILDSHPNIAVPPETGFMGAVAATKVIPNWRFRRAVVHPAGLVRGRDQPSDPRVLRAHVRALHGSAGKEPMGGEDALSRRPHPCDGGNLQRRSLRRHRAPCGRRRCLDAQSSTTPFPTRCRTGQQPTLRWCGARRRSAAGSCSAVMKTWC